MFFVVRLIKFLVFIISFSLCSTGTSPRNSRKQMQQALNTGVTSLNFDSDEENSNENRSPPQRDPFSDDDNDEGRSSIHRQIQKLKLSDVESDDESSHERTHMSATSGVGRLSSSFFSLSRCDLKFNV